MARHTGSRAGVTYVTHVLIGTHNTYARHGATAVPARLPARCPSLSGTPAGSSLAATTHYDAKTAATNAAALHATPPQLRCSAAARARRHRRRRHHHRRRGGAAARWLASSGPTARFATVKAPPFWDHRHWQHIMIVATSPRGTPHIGSNRSARQL